MAANCVPGQCPGSRHRQNDHTAVLQVEFEGAAHHRRLHRAFSTLGKASMFRMLDERRLLLQTVLSKKGLLLITRRDEKGKKRFEKIKDNEDFIISARD